MTMPVDPLSQQVEYMLEFKVSFLHNDAIAVIMTLLETPLEHLERYSIAQFYSLIDSSGFFFYLSIIPCTLIKALKLLQSFFFLDHQGCRFLTFSIECSAFDATITAILFRRMTGKWFN